MPRATLPAALALALLLAGCTSEAPVAQVEPAPAAAPPGGAATVPPAEERANATRLGNGSFAPQERDLHVTLYATAGGQHDTGNMADASWTVQVPAGARFVKASATWTASTPLSEVLDLMIHNGTAEQPGPMLTGTVGASPLATEAIALPEGVTTLDIMCHVDGDPLGVEVDQDVHLKVEFA